MDALTLYEYVILSCAGAGAGFINVIAGGGSLLTIPTMVFMDIPGPIANGTNRIAVVAQAAAAMLTFIHRGISDLKLSLTLSLSLIPGAMIGAWFGMKLEGAWFNRLLAAVMIGVLLVTQLKSPNRRVNTACADDALARPLLTHVLMGVVGFWGGLIHIGIGLLIMPVLYHVGKLDLVRVNMHKMAIVLPFSLIAMVIFAHGAGILWAAGAALALGNACGGWLGAHVTVTRGETFLKLAFDAIVIAFVFHLLFLR